jgi:hypothetical protein
MDLNQTLIYVGVGLGIFNLCIPLLKLITKKTPTQIDDDILEVLEEGLKVARQLVAETKKRGS